MADYWKSNAKKFCQICKTWYADNKISIENHERGTKHKMMVQQRLREGAQKAQRKEREQAELQSTLRQMEQAALASMLGDGRRTADEPPASGADPVGPKPLSKIERERLAFKEQQRKLADLKRTASQSQFWDGGDGNSASDDSGLQPVQPSVVLDRQWVEAQHESGSFYYWHISSGETRWEQPAEGFFTAVEYSAKYMEMMAGSTSAAEQSAACSSAGHSTVSSSAVAKSEESAASPGTAAFTAMPQSSLAGVDPFAVDNRADRRRRTAGEKRRADRSDGGDEKPSRDGLYPSEKSYRPPVKMSLRTDQADGGRAVVADSNPPSEPQAGTVKVEPTVAATVKREAEEEESRRPINVVAAIDERTPRPAHPLGAWVPVVKEEKKEARVVADLPAQTVKRKAADIVAEMEMDPSELQFQEKVLDSTTTSSLKKSSKAVQFKKRSTANKANMRQRID